MVEDKVSFYEDLSRTIIKRKINKNVGRMEQTNQITFQKNRNILRQLKFKVIPTIRNTIKKDLNKYNKKQKMVLIEELERIDLELTMLTGDIIRKLSTED